MAMNSADFEPMTRRLLEATRDLTNSFAHWSMGKASEEDVSDRYVRLGNEYVLARNRLAQSGVATDDLPDVPAELRQILELALAEEPSKAVHATFEPRVKGVMAQLFRLLKLKQLQLAPSQSQVLSGPPPRDRQDPVQQRPASASSHAHAGVPPQNAPNGPKRSLNNTPTHAYPHHPNPADPQPARARQHSIPRERAGSQDAAAPPPPGPPPQPHYHPRPAQMPVKAPNYRQQPPYADGPANPAARQRLGLPDDALVQLQNHGALERQASKRYSSHQLAQIINGSPSDKSPLPTTSVHKTAMAPDFTAHNVVRTPAEHLSEAPPQTPEQSIHRRASLQQQRKNSLNGNKSGSEPIAPKAPAPEPIPEPEEPQIPVFLRLDNRVRKVMLEQPPSLGAIRLHFVDVYKYIHSGASTFPDIVMQDEKTGIEYELNESTVTDVKEGTLLTLNVKSAKEETLESEIAALRDGMKEIAAKLDSKLALQSNNTPAPKPSPFAPQQQNRSYPSPVLTGDGRFKLDKPIPKQNQHEASGSSSPEKVEQIQKEIASIRMTATKAVSGMREELSALRAELGRLREAKVTSDAEYMTDVKDRIDSELQRLVVRIEDLSDIIDHQRVNIADRGVMYTPQELSNVRRELSNLTSEFEKAQTSIRREKLVLTNAWEASFNNIASWGEWYKGQEALIADLRNDLKQCCNVVTLVKEANEKRRQQQQQNPQLRVPVTAPPPLTKKEEEAATTAVLAEITALNLDHDQRAEAMKRAERLRRTELALRPDEFADELNQFVSDARLKENGGFELLERQREERERKARLDGEQSESEAKKQAELIKEQRRQERQQERLRKAEEAHEHKKETEQNPDNYK